MKKIIIVCLFLNLSIVYGESYYYKIGKTSCTVNFDDDFNSGICYWENGTTTKLKFVYAHTGSYIFEEFIGERYTGKFEFYEGYENGSYISDCRECNNKTYTIKLIR